MKKVKLEQLKKDLDFVALDQRLEMIKIPALSELACNPDDGCKEFEVTFACKLPEPEVPKEVGPA